MSSSRDVDRHLRVVILAGGIGARFWPASLPARPKPLLPLGESGQPLLVETVRRALSLAPPERVSILTGEHLAAPFLSALPGFPPERLWIEPRTRGTGPVLTWAAHRIHEEDPDGILVSLHSDHAIRPETAFLECVRRAAALAAREDLLLTIGASPTRPETGYGYIRAGAPIPDGAGIATGFRVEAFVEKPDLDRALGYLAQGYLWNTGIFVFPVARFLEEIRIHAPEIGRHLPLLDRGEVERFFDEVSTGSVDEEVLERSGQVGGVRADFEWDDVGGWEALTRILPADEEGNCFRGEVHAVATRESVAWAEDGPIVLFGVEDLVVVRSAGVTLVTTRERASDLKQLLAQLPAPLRDEGAAGSTGDQK